MYKIERKEKIILPNKEDRLLLLACCAPCSGETMEALKNSKIDFTLFFYNPNIFPHSEYIKREQENRNFAKKLGISYIEGTYDHQRWCETTNGLENEPERGKRCSKCFIMRLQECAHYATGHNFNLFSSVLGISRWKNMDQVNQCGEKVARQFPNLTYWDYNWRKDGGGQRMYELARRENFYQQTYCGCPYSMQ